jgi:hypothetical protein
MKTFFAFRTPCMFTVHTHRHSNDYSHLFSWGLYIHMRNVNIFSFRSPSLCYLPVHSRCRGFLFSLDHTQTHTTVGRTPLDEGSARRRDLYLTTQTLYKRIIFMPPVRFEPAIPARARLQTYALDRAATGIGSNVTVLGNIRLLPQ